MKKKDEEDVILATETEFNEKDYEEIRLLGAKKFKFYEKMRNTGSCLFHYAKCRIIHLFN